MVPDPRVTAHHPAYRAGAHMDVDSSIAQAPLPTEKTVRRRTALPTQIVRFAAINLRMVSIIIKGHG